MTYEEVGSGGVKSGCCAVVEALYARVTALGVGDTLYSIAKARRGKLEKVVIKAVRTVTSRRTYGSNRVIYQDTLNGLWNEYELVLHEEALALITIYKNARQADLDRLNSC